MARKKANRFFNKKFNEGEKKFTIIKLIEMGLSLLFILLGIILLSKSSSSDKFIAISLGILLLVEAGINIYSAIMPESNKLFKINLVFGILNIIIAILFFTNLINFENYVKIYYGIYLIISGIKYLVNTVIFKVVKEDCWLMVLITSALIIALGILEIFYPFGSFGPVEVIAIFSILYGLLNANVSNLMRSRTEKIMSKVDND